MNYPKVLLNDPKSIPCVLFKYRDWEDSHHKRILTDCEIYFPSFDQFNDPFDGSIPVRYRKEELTPENVFKKLYRLIKAEHPDWPDSKIHEKAFSIQSSGHIGDDQYWESVNEEYLRRIHTRIGVFSMASEYDNHLMWSHYANMHKGICVGFNIDELRSQIEDWGIFSISYQEELPFIELSEDHMIFAKKLLCTKSSVWSYEQEYRILRFDFARRTLRVSAESVDQVIFGLRMQQETKLKILDLVKSQFPHASVFEAKRNRDYFKIEIAQIY